MTLPLSGTPPADVEVGPAVARRLLVGQHPDLAHLAVVPAATGWDNAVYRLGDDLALRLPRRAAAVELLLHEQRWLPLLAPRLPLPVPVPVRSGQPGEGYPWPWSVVRWIAGETADRTPPVDPAGAARALGRWLAALHEPAPHDAPASRLRGVPLAARDESARALLADLDAQPPPGVDTRQLRRVWQTALHSRPWTGPPVWVHGDLHPRNIVVAGGRLAGVVDFGDLNAGDPATDLASAWMLLPVKAHPLLASAYGPTDGSTWVRARGWALLFGLLLARAASGDRDELRAQVARATFGRVLATPA